MKASVAVHAQLELFQLAIQRDRQKPLHRTVQLIVLRIDGGDLELLYQRITAAPPEVGTHVVEEMLAANRRGEVGESGLVEVENRERRADRVPFFRQRRGSSDVVWGQKVKDVVG